MISREQQLHCTQQHVCRYCTIHFKYYYQRFFYEFFEGGEGGGEVGFGLSYNCTGIQMA